MKLHIVPALGFAILASVGVATASAGMNTCDKAAAAPAAACSKSCEGKDLKALAAAALASPSAASELLRLEVAQHPERLESATLEIIATYSAKLPAKDLGLALRTVMKTASQLLEQGIPALSAPTGANAEESRQAALAQELKLAGAVDALTHRAVEAVRQNLAAPVTAIAPEADGSYPGGEMSIDPQAYGLLMKGSIEQVVRGALDGVGARVATIPQGQLPSLASVQQEKGSYAYSLNDTPVTEQVPTAVAAPVEETKAPEARSAK